MARIRENLTEPEVWTPRKNSEEEKKKVPHRTMGTLHTRVSVGGVKILMKVLRADKMEQHARLWQN